MEETEKTTKTKIIDQALRLFSTRGFYAVPVTEIAEAVGIKAPSLYKHFASKQEIFAGIIDQMSQDYQNKMEGLPITGLDPDLDSKVYEQISENQLVQMSLQLFSYFVTDPRQSQFRKLLILEQFRHPEMADLYDKQYIKAPLQFQTQVFENLQKTGHFAALDPHFLAIEFYAPFYLGLSVLDRQPDRLDETLDQLKKHIHQFSCHYHKGE